MSDSLAPAEVEPLLRGRLGRPYLYRAECESTQLLLEGQPGGAVAATELQTAGRGRMGRRWEAPAGTSIQVSVALVPPPERPTPELTVVGALAVAEGVEAATGERAQVKWPNDVLLRGRKVAGLLGELRDGRALLGIGINVSQAAEELPAGARRPAGSLRSMTGVAPPRAPLLADVLFRLEQRYDAWAVGGLGALAGELAAREWRPQPATS